MMSPVPARASDSRELAETNRRFYDPLWSEADLVEPERFNTWPLVSSLVSPGRPRLEIAPGLRPRLPLEGTHFLDVSAPAVAKLRARGANVVQGFISALPFPDGRFDPVCAFDIIEHVEDDDGALKELNRVAAPGAVLLVSVPLHPSSWTSFDDFVGHRRRYEPERIIAKLEQHGFGIEQSAIYGMKPRSSILVDAGMWLLQHRREKAMWWYRRLLMPLALRFQKRLAYSPGMITTDNVDEVLLVCRKRRASRWPSS
jgi:SAM-dependent methyltransferase